VEGWIPEERLELSAALEGYTAGASDLGPWRGETGRLEVGAPADLAVLSLRRGDDEPDPDARTGGTWVGLGTTVRSTIVGGRVVFGEGSKTR